MLSSKTIITKYTKILETLGDSFQTNMPTESMYDMINEQINTMPSWKMYNYSLNGKDSSNYTYTFGEQLLYGEPAFIEADSSGKNIYLAVGNGLENNKIEDSTFFEGITDTALLGKTVFEADGIAKTKDGTIVGAAKLVPTAITSIPAPTAKYHLVSYNPNVSGANIYYHNITNGIYITGNGVLVGGAWNDYAESRNCIEGVPGQVVCEDGYGNLVLSTHNLQSLPYVISDTYGMLIGPQDEGTKPVAISGRVLVKINSPSIAVGDVVCAGANGFAEKMTRQEIINYPDRILGIVSEIPRYESWNGIKIDGRLWIKLK
jgi:hypothetical protein